LKAHVKSTDEGKEWDEIQWDDLYPIEEVFGACCQNEAGGKRLVELVQTIRNMPEYSVDDNKEILRNAWQRVHGEKNKSGST
jgi:hypothetical protein